MAVIIDSLAILIGGYLGTKIGGKISQNIHMQIIKFLGICTIVIGINSSLEGNIIVMLVSIIIGVLVGEYIDIDKGVNDFAILMQNKYVKGSESNFSQGFVTGTLLFCIGSMSILGPLEAGVRGNNEILIAKSVLDLITSFFLAASLGAGISISGFPVLIYEGFIFLFATIVAPILTEEIINNISGTGGLMIIAIGLNMLELTEIKLANALPALIFPVIFGIFRIIFTGST